MYALIVVSLMTFLASAQNCKQYERAAALLDTRNFLRESQLQRAKGAEAILQLSDVNQARSLAYRFPAFEDLGFGKPGGQGWTRYEGRLAKSKLNEKKIGWEIRNEHGHARVRLDWDPDKGAHYNIEISSLDADGRRETNKLAVEFLCQGRKCTQDQVVRMVDQMQ